MALTDKLVAIGNAIRAKTGGTAKLSLTDMVTEIGKLWKASSPTAAAGDVLSGKSFVNSSGTLTNGTMTNRGAVSQSLAINGSYTIPAGYHNGSGKVTQSITTKGAATYGAKTSAQTIAAGQYLSGAQTIAAVTQTNLTAANIVKGKTITIKSNGSNLWSVTGTATGGNATHLAQDYSNDVKSKVHTYTSTVSGAILVTAAYNTKDGYNVPETFTCQTTVGTVTQLSTGHQKNGSSTYKYNDLNTSIWLVTGVTTSSTITVTVTDDDKFVTIVDFFQLT